MVRELAPAQALAAYRRLVAGFLDGDLPAGVEFDAWRYLVREEPTSRTALIALTNLLEGALADPTLGVEETQLLVPLLKSLARRQVSVEDLVP